MLGKFLIILNVVQFSFSTTPTVVTVTENLVRNRFPDNFLFGVATAAFQIEGGWNESGRGLSIWDTFTHDHPEKIADRSNADIGPNSYHLFDEDLKALKEVGINFYRLSISWTRILPNGDVSSLNQAGVDYYNDVINKLIANNIQPMITMIHYDLPEYLQKLGGFLNPLFIQYFEQYADLLFSLFSDRVKLWITFNEPYDYCTSGYSDAIYPPLIDAHGVGEYLCIDNTIKAHAKAYRIYREKYYEKSNGKIGMSLSSRYFYSNDSELVDRAMQFGLGWLAHPIYSKNGGYPSIMIEEVARNSLREGRRWSRLPDMSEEWRDIIKGSADFFGLNYYTSRFAEFADPPEGANPSTYRDSRIKATIDPSWKRAKSTWLYSVPQGLRDLLKWINDEYNNIEVFITENGWSDDGEINDVDRIEYFRDHLNAVLKAVTEYKCNVAGYAHWSIIDNFEWLKGYTERFGLYSVNFNSPNRERTAKKSANFYKTVIETREIPEEF